MTRKITITMKIEIKCDAVVYCAICGQPIQKNQKLTLDHWVPKNKGGASDLTNLKPAHKICNSIKSNLMPNAFLRKKKALFENALENWHLKYQDKKIIQNALYAMNKSKAR